ncbi:MAG: DNA polymerase/3'-5' exonuclease PolX, partial [Ignavibacteriales bacterium]|nr:DNA polymerase/3'-5' exonuclease PolX [Ignavibacteriales bacterium]
MVDKRAVSRMFYEIGTLLELKGENRFKCIAYQNAARNIEALTVDLEELIKRDELKDVRGIGKTMAENIVEYVQTGRIRFYDELRSSIPEGVIEMLRVHGLGPKKVKLLYEKLKIKSLQELQEAAENEKLRDVTGFGQKTEENILKGIEALRTTSDRQLYPKAKEAADKIVSALKKMREVKRVDVAGSLRRRKEVIGDIDIVVSAQKKDRQKIAAAFVSHAEVANIIGQGDTKASVVLKGGINSDLRIVEDSEYPFALNYFTGSKEHNVEMRTLARKLGWSLNEYEFSKIEGMKSKAPPKCRDESEIYKALGLRYVEPELRENMGEFEASVEDKLPKLLDFKDLRGTFHCHSTYSDGANTLEEMAEACRNLGWSYLGIADHSQIAVYANGLPVEKIREQHKEIDKLNGRFKNFRIFKGTEVDILGDGALDYPDKVLASFEFVVAAIHSRMKMTAQEATERILKAIKNKYVTILGHPTGRLLLSRDGYPVDMVEVINAAADYGKSIEINSHPIRLDLDWRLVKYAK